MRLITSNKFSLPKVYFITDREKIKDIPVGVPFIYGDENMYEHMVRILEYEVLYQEAIKSGYPFDFKKILRDNGFTDIKDYAFDSPVYIDIKSSREYTHHNDGTSLDTRQGQKKFKKFVKDSSVYVDINKLKNLNVFPIWLDKIEDAVSTNIHNFAVYNENMYNKKLEGMYGSLDLIAPNRNLIIIDISASIPKAVSSTTLALAKNLAENFYADLLITGSKSTLYQYENLHELNVETIYEENGMDNDQVYFKKLVTQEAKSYKTAIVFGDNHSPGWSWSNSYNRGTRSISKEDGQRLCKWRVDKVISFHTSVKQTDKERVAGYAEWFSPREIEYIKDWVKYLKK